MKKKVLSLLLIGLMVIGLTGCGSESKDGESGKSQDSSISQKVKVGDYVDYKVEEGKTYTATADKTGYSKDQVFETTGEEKWRVLSINEDGTIDLILDGYVGTKYEKGLYLKDRTGYENSVEVLNDISAIYGTGNNAKSARSLTAEDINKMIDLDELVKYYQNKYEVDIDTSGSREQTFENVYKVANKFYGQEKKFGDETFVINSTFDWSSGMNSFGLETVIKDETYLSMLKIEDAKEIWLADKMIEYSENPMMGWTRADLKVGKYYYNKFSSFGSESLNGISADMNGGHAQKAGQSERGFYVRPVVTIKADAKLNGGKGTESEPWEF